MFSKHSIDKIYIHIYIYGYILRNTEDHQLESFDMLAKDRSQNMKLKNEMKSGTQRWCWFCSHLHLYEGVKQVAEGLCKKGQDWAPLEDAGKLKEFPPGLQSTLGFLATRRSSHFLPLGSVSFTHEGLTSTAEFLLVDSQIPTGALPTESQRPCLPPTHPDKTGRRWLSRLLGSLLKNLGLGSLLTVKFSIWLWPRTLVITAHRAEATIYLPESI